MATKKDEVTEAPEQPATEQAGKFDKKADDERRKALSKVVDWSAYPNKYEK